MSARQSLSAVACALVASLIAPDPGVARAEPPVRDALGRPARAGTAPRDPSAIVICLLPLGKYDRRLMARAASGIQYLYGFSVTTMKPRAIPRSTYYRPRKRYRAEKILAHIAGEIAPDTDCQAVVGFTAHDISTTKGKIKDWGILGMAHVGGNAAVVSTYRVRRKANRRKQAIRTIKVMNHELGHALGLDHYDDEPGCVMNDAKGTVKTVDEESGLLCAPSRRYIEQTHRIALPEHDAFDWDRVLGR